VLFFYQARESGSSTTDEAAWKIKKVITLGGK
jgi:hypothetical protein